MLNKSWLLPSIHPIWPTDSPRPTWERAATAVTIDADDADDFTTTVQGGKVLC